MAVRVRGFRKVGNNLNSFIRGVENRVTKKALTDAIITASGYAAIMTPVDTENLIGGQYMFVDPQGSGWLAGVGYLANYAGYVHDGGPKRWQKPGASDQFLVKAFEDNIPELRQIIINGYKV